MWRFGRPGEWRRDAAARPARLMGHRRPGCPRGTLAPSGRCGAAWSGGTFMTPQGVIGLAARVASGTAVDGGGISDGWEVGGSSLPGRRMRTWLVNGTTHLGNRMEMLRTKVSKPLRTIGSMPFQQSTLSSATRIRPWCCSSQ